MRGIPFTISDVHGGLTEACGRLGVEGEDVVIEVELKLFSLFKQKAKTYRFHLVDLDEVHHKRGLTGDKLAISTNPLDLVTRIPGSQAGELVLAFKRKHREALDKLLDDHLYLWRT